jgi:1,4-dihydroxy-2-naphthoyl-CoA hydrolase
MNLAPDFMARGAEGLPGLLGLVFTVVTPTEVRGEMALGPRLMAPNGFLHAGALVSLADTCCGYGCRVAVPPEASGFTTMELKTNHFATATEGTVDCIARPLHAGRTTQVWDATATHRETGRVLMSFRCTQLVLYPKK